jgi:hypothetical protein
MGEVLKCVQLALQRNARTSRRAASSFGRSLTVQ